MAIPITFKLIPRWNHGDVFNDTQIPCETQEVYVYGFLMSLRKYFEWEHFNQSDWTTFIGSTNKNEVLWYTTKYIFEIYTAVKTQKSENDIIDISVLVEWIF